MTTAAGRALPSAPLLACPTGSRMRHIWKGEGGASRRIATLIAVDMQGAFATTRTTGGAAPPALASHPLHHCGQRCLRDPWALTRSASATSTTMVVLLRQRRAQPARQAPEGGAATTHTDASASVVVQAGWRASMRITMCWKAEKCVCWKASMPGRV
eukprot:CAMPEP_0174754684 /NCGR_PEP_ID=MMETSP1094-20130205/105861_1 /TAXON_ID=156173 /ORGANISM="Chrysochromulina brevifilum, Strain UTEX LB 985" /LENGTH=156 /DNA_ID=CAMNT_0015960563 /DNA_START=1061 /DNA_END=1532 /DNA_ORIENTATION=+